MKALRVALALSAVALASTPFAAGAEPSSRAGDDLQRMKVGSLAEAWYVTSPVSTGDAGVADPGSLLDLTCTLPTGCIGSPVPLDTVLASETGLHVIYALGSTLADSFLLPNLTDIPFGAEDVGGTLRLPVNTAVESANANLEAATLQACLVTGLIVDGVRAGATGSPTFDCAKVAVPAKYDAETSVFTIDLGPFLKDWAPGDLAPGLALVPADDSDPLSVWHVNLSGSDAEDGAVPTWRITYRPGSPVDPVVPVDPIDEGGSAPSGGSAGAGGIDLGSPVVPIDEPVAGDPEVGAPDTAPTTSATVAAPPLQLLNKAWYRYPGVAFLPIVLFAAVAFAGRALTSPLPRRRTGPV
ncbi:MAG: hypothetical protein F2667_11370 [Actinobacteria bacterium]|uniref:Unannotated protein n=1 Tax=freshwater metagenome TaxID=449393 RepID=A0A6J6RMU0_9ZZZZ|nr:hypothetical protein [Actinomycetota bacterium]